MRRAALIAAAIAALAAAGAAYAAATDFNTYTAKLKFTSRAAGTAKQPMPVGFTQNIAVTGANGNRSGILQDITTTIYGLRLDAKDFPTCSMKAINRARNDKVCPRGAKVATGYISGSLGPQHDFAQPGQPCDPGLDVWNSGQGRLTFFFVDRGPHQCLNRAIRTGDLAAFPATYQTMGRKLVIDVPVPDYAGFMGSLAMSVQKEHLVFKKRTRKLKGRQVALISSVGCRGRKRPYSTTLTAILPAPPPAATQTTTVKGHAACTKPRRPAPRPPLDKRHPRQ